MMSTGVDREAVSVTTSARRAAPLSSSSAPPRKPPTAGIEHGDDNDDLSCASLLASVRAQVQDARHNFSRSHIMFFLKQHVPILEWLPTYDLREDLQYDIVAGVTVGMMIVPQEISLSTMMGVPPIYGLYTAALVPMLYPLFGTSRVLSVANGAEVSLLVGSAIKKIESVDERVATGILLSFLTGLLLLIMGVFRLGVLADFFSRPVMGGFISAGGVLIMLSQCANWFGVKVPGRDLPFLTVLDLIEQSPHLNASSFLLGVVSIGILLGMRWLKRRVVREMTRLEDALEDAFATEHARALDRLSSSSKSDVLADGDNNYDEDDDDTQGSVYDDVELGDVHVAATDSAALSAVDPSVEPANERKKLQRPRRDDLLSSGTPRQAHAPTRWPHLPSIRSTSALRRSDLLASPWAPGARRLDTFGGSSSSSDLIDFDARSCRQSDLMMLGARSTRHRHGAASSLIDEGVGFSLSDEDYLTRDQPLEFAYGARRAGADDAASRFAASSTMNAPPLVRSSSESSMPSRGPTPRRRKGSAQGNDEMLAVPPHGRSTESETNASARDDTAASVSARQLRVPLPSTAALPTRQKLTASPAQSVVSDTDSACSTTALTRGSSSSSETLDDAACSSHTIRVVRSKLAVLVALRLVCELGAFTVCLIGGIVGYLSPKGTLVLTGDVPGGYPTPKLPWYGLLSKVIEADRLSHVIIDTLSIALIVYMSSVAMAKRLAIKEGYRIRPNQELVALGLSNLIGSFFQSMPATGGLSRTAVNMQNARTQLASLITVGVVVLALYTATSALAFLPKASLAAIIIVAGQSLIETAEAKWLYRVKRDEFVVWLASFVLTVTLGVLPGLLSSIFCSLVAVIYKTRRPTLTLLGYAPARDDAPPGAPRQLVDLELHPDAAEPLIDIVAVRVEGALYFANCEHIERVVEREIRKRQQTADVCVRGVVIDAGSIMDWDSTTIQMMKHLQADLMARSIVLAIVNARERLQRLLASSDYLGGIVRRDARIGFDEAITAIRNGDEQDDDGSGGETDVRDLAHVRDVATW